MPAHSASEDARERAYGAGIHVFLADALRGRRKKEKGMKKPRQTRPLVGGVSFEIRWVPPQRQPDFDHPASGSLAPASGASVMTITKTCFCATRRKRFHTGPVAGSIFQPPQSPLPQ